MAKVMRTGLDDGPPLKGVRLRTYFCERDRLKFKSDVEICPVCRMPAVKFSKYGNVAKEIDGVTYGSKWEAEYHGNLMLAATDPKSGVTELQRQVPFRLDVTGADGNLHHIATYVADHVYKQDGALVVADSKGRTTAVFRMKKKLMLALHAIDVQEVRRPARSKRRR